MNQAVLDVLAEIQALAKAVKNGEMTAKDYGTALLKVVEENINRRLEPADAEMLLTALKRMLPAKSYDRMVEYVIKKRSLAQATEKLASMQASSMESAMPPPAPQESGGANPRGGFQQAMGAAAMATETPPAAEAQSGGEFTVEVVPLPKSEQFARSFLYAMYPVWCLVTYFYNDDALRMADRYDTPGLKFEMWHAVVTGVISLILGIMVGKNVRPAFWIARFFLAVMALSALYLAFIHEYLWLADSFARYPQDFSGMGEVWSKAFSYMFEEPMHYVRLGYAVPAVIAIFLLGRPPEPPQPWRG